MNILGKKAQTHHSRALTPPTGKERSHIYFCLVNFQVIGLQTCSLTWRNVWVFIYYKILNNKAVWICIKFHTPFYYRTNYRHIPVPLPSGSAASPMFSSSICGSEFSLRDTLWMQLAVTCTLLLLQPVLLSVFQSTSQWYIVTALCFLFLVQCDIAGLI